MHKISQEKAAQVLKEASAALLRQRGQIEELEQKVAEYQRREQVMKLASQIHDRGMTDKPLDVLQDELQKVAEEGHLQRVEDAFHNFPGMFQKLGSLEDKTSGESAGGSAFEQLLLGQI